MPKKCSVCEKFIPNTHRFFCKECYSNSTWSSLSVNLAEDHAPSVVLIGLVTFLLSIFFQNYPFIYLGLLICIIGLIIAYNKMGK